MAALATNYWCIFAATPNCEPQQSGRKVCEIDVRQLPVGSFGDWIEVPDQREQHSGSSEPGDDLGSRTKDAVVAQVTRQGNANQSIGPDKAVSREGTEPAVDVQSAGAARCQHGDRQERRHSGDDDGATRCLMLSVSRTQRDVGEPVVRHQQQY